MRLYYLSNSMIPSKLANSIQVMKMCRAFSEHFEKVVLFAQHQDSDEKDIFKYYGVDPTFEVVRTQTSNQQGFRRLQHAWQILRRIWKDKGSKELFARDYFVMGMIAIFRLVKAPMWFESHQPPHSRLQTFLQKQIFLSPYFTKLVVISQALGDEYLRLFGPLVEGKIIVAHDGADTNLIPDHLINKSVYSNKENAFKVGYIGSFYPGKGITTIMKLVPMMPDCEFHVVGGKPHEVEHYKRACKTDNLVLHGFVSPQQIYEFMDDFDVVLAPYLPNVNIGDRKGSLRGDIAKWMSPLKLFEYMAGGKPIIASDLPVLREVLKYGENALLADPSDMESWCVEIRKMKASAELREKLGKQAQKDFFDNYTWKKRAEHILGVDAALSPTSTAHTPNIA